MVLVQEMSAAELKRRLDAGEPLCIVDVREPWECEIVRLEASQNIPLGQIRQRCAELDAQTDIVLMCKAGGRSRMAAQLLAERGFARVFNLTGGIDAWTRDIEPQLPVY